MRLESEDGTPYRQPLWAVLSPAEARLLMESLAVFFEESEDDPGWHHHVGEGADELTIAIETPRAAEGA